MYLKANNISCCIRNNLFSLTDDITLLLTDKTVLWGISEAKNKTNSKRKNKNEERSNKMFD